MIGEARGITGRRSVAFTDDTVASLKNEVKSTTKMHPLVIRPTVVFHIYNSILFYLKRPCLNVTIETCTNV